MDKCYFTIPNFEQLIESIHGEVLLNLINSKVLSFLQNNKDFPNPLLLKTIGFKYEKKKNTVR